MAEKDKDAEIKRKAETLGIDKKKQSLLDKLDAKFPELALMAQEQEISERKRFLTLKKEFDVLLDMEEKRIKIATLNPNFNPEDTLMRPEIAQQLNELQDKIVNIVRGPGEQEVEQLLKENPELFELSEGVSLSEQEVAELIVNPEELSGAVDSLNELGNTEAANKLSELVAFNIQQNALTTGQGTVQIPPRTAPQSQVSPLEDPNLVGPTANPIENIKNNIRNFLQGSSAGAVAAGANVVDRIAPSLKRVQAQEIQKRAVTGGLA